MDSLNISDTEYVPKTASLLLGDVFCKYNIISYDLPIVVTFSNMGIATTLEQSNSLNYSPWGFEVVKNFGYNVISFSCFETDNWYRSASFLNHVDAIRHFLEKFPARIGYGGSMGGFGVGSFSKALKFDRVLLFNPISSLNFNLAPWETRYKEAKSLNWNGEYADGADFDCDGYIVFDPLFSLDRNHAKRYKNLVALKIPGVGHAMPKHLSKLGLLKQLFQDFLKDDVDVSIFHRHAKKRKLYPHHYSWLLSPQNLHLTPKRRIVIERHKRALEAYLHEPDNIKEQKFLAALRDAAIALENSHFDLSRTLMTKAFEIMPNGRVIKTKFLEYEQKVLDEP